MGNDTRANILMNFLIRVVQGLDALKTAKRLLVGNQNDEKKEQPEPKERQSI